MDPFVVAGQVILTILQVAVVSVGVAYVGFTLRYHLRSLYHTFRTSQAGETQWYQIIGTGDRKDDSEEWIRRVSNAVMEFTSTVKASSWPYLDRPIAGALWNRDENGVVCLYIGMSSRHLATESERHGIQNNGSVAHLARSIGGRARAVTTAELPEMDATTMSIALRSDLETTKATAFPDSVGTVADAIHRSASPVTVLMTIDGVRKAERGRRAGLQNEMASIEGGEATVTSAGSGSTAAATQLIQNSNTRVTLAAAVPYGTQNGAEITNNTLSMSVAAMKGLPVSVVCRRPHKHHRRTAFFVGLLALAVLFLGSRTLPVVERSIIPETLAYVLGGLVLASGILVLLLPVQLVCLPMQRWLNQGIVPVPEYVYSLFNPRYLGRTWFNSLRRDRGTGSRKGNRVGHPSCREVITSYGTPNTEFLSQPPDRSDSFVVRDAIPRVGLSGALKEMRGYFVYGETGNGQTVRYSEKDIAYGSHLSGGPGRGKTNAEMVMYLNQVHATAHRRDLTITPLWQDVKGDKEFLAWVAMVRAINPNALVVDLNNPDGEFRLALEGKRLASGLTPKQVVNEADKFFESFKFTFGEIAIGPASSEALKYSMRIAYLLSAEEIRTIGVPEDVYPECPNIPLLVWFILGGSTQIQAGPGLLSLMEALGRRAQTDGGQSLTDRERELGANIQYISQLLAGGKRAEEIMFAPRNKLTDFISSSVWQPAPGKRDLYVEDLVPMGVPILINAGPAILADGTPTRTPVSQGISVLQVFNYLLWQEQRRTCSSWGKENRYLTLFADEASVVLPKSVPEGMEVAAQRADLGRSFGTSDNLATQRLTGQVDDNSYSVLSGMQNRHFFRHLDRDDADKVVYKIGSEDTRFGATNVMNCPRGISISTIKQDEYLTTPFTMVWPNAVEFAECLARSSTPEEAYDLYKATSSIDPTLLGVDGVRPSESMRERKSLAWLAPAISPLGSGEDEDEALQRVWDGTESAPVLTWGDVDEADQVENA